MQPGSALDRALNHDDMHAARELEDAIDRRGLQRVYLHALLCEIEPNHGYHWQYSNSVQGIWAYIRATPEQRARAFLAATAE